jgi:hypothetical protein
VQRYRAKGWFLAWLSRNRQSEPFRGANRSRLSRAYDGPMAGELLPIGTRPRLVASFESPGADDEYRRWRNEHAEALVEVPPDAMRVEYGRAQGGGLYVRVRIDEEHLPAALVS